MIGQTISHYRILEKLGEGGMGVVYAAEDTLLGRRVAIKFLTVTRDGERFRRRFLREARSASALTHPHIATIYDYGETPDGEPFIVMELVGGQTLAETLEDGSIEMARAVEIVCKVAEALAEAHRFGIIHRDIKPSNVIVNERGTVKVLDFGLAKQLRDERMPSAGLDSPTLIETQTSEGIVLGTPLYLSPEQALGTPVDARSDLFSLGSVLYECVAGRPAFPGAGVIEIIGQVIHVNPVPPSQLNPSVPPSLDRVALKALAKKPDERYQSAEEMLADLRHAHAALAAEEIPRTRVVERPRGTSPLSRALKTLQQRRAPRVLNAVLAALLVALVGVAVWRAVPPRPNRKAVEKYQDGMRELRDGTYYRASKTLEDAVGIDDQFALAHAALAEAMMELDYSKRAMAELLSAQDRARKEFTFLEYVHNSTDHLYLEAIDATIRRDFRPAIEAYTEIARRSPKESYVYVDLGYAYEKNEELDKAVESYKKAAELDPSNASAFLRLGALYGRRVDADDLSKAAQAFDTAERLYDRQDNDEGVAEVRYRRGALYNRLDKLDAAQEQLEEVLRTPRANEYQQVKALLQLSSVFCSRGETAAAEKYADQALARAEGMENVKASGLIDLGNAFFYRGPQFYGNAEKYFNKALNYAAGNGQQTEMRARLMLGNLRIQQGDPNTAFGYVKPALDFYSNGHYRKESLQAWNLLGRAYRQKGDYEAAARAYEQALQIPEQVDPSQVAYAHSGLGNLYASREQFPKALGHYQESYRINRALGAELQADYDMLNISNTRWLLGDDGGTEQVLKELEGSLKADAGFNELRAWIPLMRAHLALSRLQLTEAIDRGTEALKSAGTAYKSVALEATYVLGLAKTLAGARDEGVRLCEGAVNRGRGMTNPLPLSAALLAQSEALLKVGDAKGALASSLEARERFKHAGQQVSEWRASAVAALASRLSGDAEHAVSYAGDAAALESSLRQEWGEETYNKYLSRRDVQYYWEQLRRPLQ